MLQLESSTLDIDLAFSNVVRILEDYRIAIKDAATTREIKAVSKPAQCVVILCTNCNEQYNCTELVALQ